MLLVTVIPNQFVQEHLDDLCVVTSPHRRELMENFVRTHRAVCDRVGVKLATETDKETAFPRHDTQTWWSSFQGEVYPAHSS